MRIHLDLRLIQHQIGNWGIKTFGPGDSGLPEYHHLTDEVAELGRALEGGRVLESEDGVAEEMADILILLLQIAHRRGIDLTDALYAKHRENLARRWGKPDARGVVRPVEEVPHG